jgi:hypothetical protein
MKTISFLATFFTFYVISFTQNVGIGTSTPQATLDVVGSIKTSTLQVTTGAAQDKIMVSDNVGNAVWSSAPTPNIGYYNLTSSTVFTTLNTSWTNIPDLIATPIAGTYYVSSVLNHAASGASQCSFALQVGNSVVSNTELNGIQLSGRITTNVQGIVSLNGSQTISTVCRRSQGDAISITERSMVLLRLN